jgi:superfamily II DNA or RNA helicase
MPQDIIDNQKEKLVEHIKKLLKNSKAAKFAVGYFFASGLRPIINDLEKLDEIRLLIGSSTNRQTLEAMALGYQKLDKITDMIERKSYLTYQQKKDEFEKNEKSIEKAIARLKQSDENESLVKRIASLIEAGRIKVKIYLKTPLHAKAYIFDFKKGQYYKGAAVIGSSNLSLAGITDNTELNIVVSGNENHKRLTEWFNILWQEAEEFDENLFKTLKNSWAVNEPTPYELYLKVLYELVKDRLEVEEVKLTKRLALPQLYKFQQDAVTQACRILNRYNGVFISDVVGLGKTYIASAMLAHFYETQGDRAIVICPPSLRKYWKDIVWSFGVPVQVFSSGKPSEVLENELLLKDTKIVVVDESHHFRNPTTKRYEDLSEVVFGKKVILVTATPYNLSPKDIYHQIKLFHPQEWTDIPIDPPFLNKFTSAVENKERSLKELLWHILIRRTRNDIRRYYKEDLEKWNLKFPKRLGPYRIEYSIDKVYPGIYDEISKLLKSLKYSRYNIGSYVKEKFKREPEFTKLKQIGPQLVAIMKAVVFKRLESSVKAFQITIGTFIEIYKAFLKALEQGVILAGAEGESLLDALIRGDDRGFEELVASQEEKYPIEKFKKEELKRDLKYDLEVLYKLQESIKGLGFKEDAKIQKLISGLKGEKFRDKKVLIFTQFEATSSYLGKHLKDYFDKAVDVSSQTHKIMDIVKKFAPEANKAEVPIGEQIKILVATDVLSEGLNLQDANIVINYDLHWNPVRLIQRVGRVDRVTTKYDEILVYNFFPERDLERHLGIEEKVKRRVEDIQNNIGEDAKILSEDEKLQVNKFFQIYKEKPEVLEEEITESTFEDYVQLLKRVKVENKELFKKIESLPPKIRSCRKYANKKGIIIFCKYGDFYKFYLVDGRGEIIPQDLNNAIQVLTCDKGEKRLVLPLNFNKQVRKAEELFESEMKKRDQELENKESDPNIKPILKILKILPRGETKEFKKKASEIMRLLLTRILSISQKKELRRLRKEKKENKEEFLEKLEKILKRSENETQSLISEEKYVEIVASEGLV